MKNLCRGRLPVCAAVFTVLMAMPISSLSQMLKSGNLQSYVNTFVDNMPRTPGGNNYQTPSTSQLARFGQALQYVLQGNLHWSDSVAATIGYQLLQFTDTATVPQRLFYVLEKNPTSTTHWGTFIIASSPQRPNLVIQCPHPLHDSQTGKQGMHIFLRTGAYAYLVAGTHRCNNLAASSCSGTTTACTGEEDPYTISDQAHVVNSTFQRATETLAARNPQAVFIQLHGFAQEAGDPDAIMSNGTRLTPAIDNIVAIRNGLLQQDGSLTFKIVHLDLSWTKLTAFDNTQGRYLNGSSNPCSQSASIPGGRFIHIEQAYDKLRSSEQNWNKMAGGLGVAFPATSDVVRLHDAGELPQEIELNQNYPNPFNPSTTIPFDIGHRAFVTLKVYDLLGREVSTLLSKEMMPGRYGISFDTHELVSGMYLYRLTTPLSSQTRRMAVIR